MSRLTERAENFNKAFDMFERTYNLYLTDKINEAYQLAVIQGFEINFELSWKVMKDYLAYKGVSTTTPKESIKEAFMANILPNAQIWIDMIKDRNLSSHEYEFEKIMEILEKIEKVYFREIKNFNSFIRSL